MVVNPTLQPIRVLRVQRQTRQTTDRLLIEVNSMGVQRATLNRVYVSLLRHEDGQVWQDVRSC